MIELSKNILLFENNIDSEYYIELIDRVNNNCYPLKYANRRPHKTMELPYLYSESDTAEALELRLKFLSITSYPIWLYCNLYGISGITPKKTFITVSKLEPGKGMIEHQDNYYESSNFICMFYINDEYEGGEIFFPEIDISHKPKSGDILIYKSNLVHGVNKVVGTDRYSIGYGFAGPKA